MIDIGPFEELRKGVPQDTERDQDRDRDRDWDSHFQSYLDPDSMRVSHHIT